MPVAHIGVSGVHVVEFVSAGSELIELGELRNALAAAFFVQADESAGKGLPLGPLVTILVTLSGIQATGLGAPFWGLVAGVVVTWLLDDVTGDSPSRC